MADGKFEAFTDEELAQLGGGEDQVEDDDLPQDTDDEDEGGEQEEEKDENAEESEGDEEEVETDDDGKPLKKESKVNLGALHEERAERKRYQGIAMELQDKYARLETRMEMILAGFEKQQTAEVEEEIPDKSVDPLGYIEYMEKRLSKLEGKTVETEKLTKEQQEQQQHQENLNQALRHGNAMAAEVRAKDPETYDAALTFTVTRRAAELRALGTPEADIAPQINNEMQAGMIRALQRKMNPGDFLLQYAKAQGFTGKKASGDLNGKKSVSEIAEAKTKNKSLGQGSAPGSTPGKSMARAVAEMNDAQFASWYEKNLKGGKNKEFANLFKE